VVNAARPAAPATPVRTGEPITTGPPPLPRNLVVDLDGTLVDTAYLRVLSWWQALQQYGHVVSMARLHRAAGKLPSEVLDHVLRSDRDTGPDAQITAAQSVLFATWHDQAQPLPGAVGLVRWALERGLGVALAASCGRRDVDALLPGLGHPDFDVVTTVDDVGSPQSWVEVLAHAVQRLDGDATDTVVVAPSVWHVEACRLLGLPCIGVETAGTGATDLVAAGAVAAYATPEHLRLAWSQAAADPTTRDRTVRA
jgi:beta-phosphoglucomutase-like phosphatase (HAD superfamily)